VEDSKSVGGREEGEKGEEREREREDRMIVIVWDLNRERGGR
jgi:hypothetical protein